MAGTGWRGRALLVAVLVLGSSCRSATEEFPPRPQMVDVSMREYGYVYEPPKASGRIVFNVENTGQVVHEMVLVSVGDEIPPIDKQLRSGERVIVPTVARMAQKAPGSWGALAVDLVPGRYALVCFVKDPDGGQHAQRGMNTEFRIG